MPILRTIVCVVAAVALVVVNDAKHRMIIASMFTGWSLSLLLLEKLFSNNLEKAVRKALFEDAQNERMKAALMPSLREHDEIMRKMPQTSDSPDQRALGHPTTADS